jgi:hypothetical protein
VLPNTGFALGPDNGDGYSISPEFNVDFSEHETLYVIGLSFGFGW